MTIKELLKQKGLSQSALSSKYSIPLRTIQDWCAGRRTPPEYVVLLIEKCLKYEAGNE